MMKEVKAPRVIRLPSGSRMNYFKNILEVLNVIQPDKTKRISPTELDLLAGFFSLDPDKFKYQRFSKIGKKRVMELLNGDSETEEAELKMSKENLNYKLYKLIEKGYLVRDEDGIIELKKYLEELVNEAHLCLKESRDLDLVIRISKVE